MNEIEFKEFLTKEFTEFSVRMQEDIKLITDKVESGEIDDILDCTVAVFEEIDEDYVEVIDTIGEEFDKHFTPEENEELFKSVEKLVMDNAEKINDLKYEIGNSFVSVVDETMEGAE